MLLEDICLDVTKTARKIPQGQYASEGRFKIFDQGKDLVSGYCDSSEGVAKDPPYIVFGDHTRILKYVSEPCFIGADGVKLLKVANSGFIPKYVYYALLADPVESQGYSRHYKILKEKTIRLVNHHQQLEIINLFDSIFRAIAIAQSILISLDDIIKSRFIEMFGDYSFNPMGWPLCHIGDVVTNVRYGTSLPASEDGEYPYLRMNNITYEGELDLSELKRINVPLKDIDKCSVRKGDVLFNRTNSWDKVGKTCVYNQDEMMILAGFIIRVRVTNCILPEFLSAFLNTSSSKETLKRICKRAIGQANINAEEMKNIGIYLPPISLQTEYVSFKQQVDKSKLVIKKTLKELEELKNSLMQKYFFD